VQPFTDLKVWQRSHKLTLELYRLTASFPSDERFGLVSQIRRAAVSVPANIVEGTKRSHARDYGRFLNIAEGSTAELSYLIILSRDLGFIDKERSSALLVELDEISRMLYVLRQKVERTPPIADN
jgi:four helix bundle protein